MAASFWVKQTLTPTTALPAFVRWLVNTTGLWTIVEAYDANANVREVPGDTTDIDTLSTAVEWPNGTLTANSWIVLQSTNAGQQCQIYLDQDTTTRFEYCLIPKADFVTNDGGSESTPAFPATTLGDGAFVAGAAQLINTSTIQASMVYSAICDDGCINLIIDDGVLANRKYIEMGKLLTSHPSDLFPFCINYSLGFWCSSSPRYCKLSPVDGTTLCLGYDLEARTPAGGSYNLFDLTGQDGTDSEWLIYPAAYKFNTVGHAHAVVPKYKYWCSMDMSAEGTIASLAYVQLSSDASYGHTAFDWDGANAYGVGDQSGYLLSAITDYGVTVEVETADLPSARAGGYQLNEVDNILTSKRKEPVIPTERVQVFTS